MSEAGIVLDGPEESTEEQVSPQEQAPEAAATTAETEQPVTFDERQQAKFNEEIGKKVAKQREAERKAEEAERKWQEAQQRLSELQAPIRPDIPPLPDPYDEQYAAKVQHRDAMIARAAQFDAQAQWSQQQEQQRKQQEAIKQQQQLQEHVTNYTDRASKLGIQSQELQVAGYTVAQYGINDRLATRILNDEQGPAVTLYLSQNMLELDTLNRLEPEDAAVYLETVVKPKAKRSPPSLAPAPVEPVKGSGVPEGERGPKGAQYF